MTQCCIVGAGPAGAVLGLLLARQGVTVTLLETHMDFERDFRGDTVHPSTLELTEKLGLVDRLLAIPHATIRNMPMHTRTGTVIFGGYPRTRLISSRHPNALLLAQARFLELLTSEAGRYPSFQLVMGARVESLIEDRGWIRGVRYRSQTDGCLHELAADLTVAADGRFSKIRQLVGFQPVSVAQPIDCLWFRLPHFPADAADAPGVYVGGGRVMVVFDRGREWQASYWLPKGGYQQLRAAGIADLQRSVADLAPWLGDRVDRLRDWSKASLLTVESSRLRRWYRPGLLLIGDAAHVMAPVGGVGINLAIQDAVAAARVLAPRLREGNVRVRDLAAVQRRRQFPTYLVQRLQAITQWQMLRKAEFDDGDNRLPLVWRVALRIPNLRAFRARIFAYGGLWPEPVDV